MLYIGKLIIDEAVRLVEGRRPSFLDEAWLTGE